MKPLDERSHTFVVRIWEERRDLPGADRAWRGSVEDVQGGTRAHFATLRELCDVLRGRCGMPEAGTRSRRWPGLRWWGRERGDPR